MSKSWLHVGGNVCGIDGITRSILNQFLDHIDFENMPDRWIELLNPSDFSSLRDIDIGGVIVQKVCLFDDAREFVENNPVRKDLWDQAKRCLPYQTNQRAVTNHSYRCLESLVGKQMKTAKKWPDFKKEILSNRKKLKKTADVIDG